MVDSPTKFLYYSDTTNCVFKLLDTITALSIKGDEDFLNCLGKLFYVSDGEVAEYFESKGSELFYKGFKNVINYAYAKKDVSIERMLVYSLSMDVSVASNRELEKNRIHSFIKKKEREYYFSPAKKEYLNKFEKKIDPKIFD
jgi:hypothetical protein